jgi:hypothetical protein
MQATARRSSMSTGPPRELDRVDPADAWWQAAPDWLLPGGVARVSNRKLLLNELSSRAGEAARTINPRERDRLLAIIDLVEGTLSIDPSRPDVRIP